MPRKFVVLEGGDCSGKTTFMRFLRETYPEFLYVAEPGSTPVGMQIRQLLLRKPGADDLHNSTEFHLFWASKFENMNRLVLPQLEAGQVVVSDRFDGSTFAYQVAQDQKLEKLFWQTRAVCLQGIVPHYLFFDVDAEIQRERVGGRPEEQNHLDLKDLQYHNKVRASYLRFFNDKSVRWSRIDASLSKDQVLESAHAVFKKLAGV